MCSYSCIDLSIAVIMQESDTTKTSSLAGSMTASLRIGSAAVLDINDILQRLEAYTSPRNDGPEHVRVLVVPLCSLSSSCRFWPTPPIELWHRVKRRRTNDDDAKLDRLSWLSN